MATETLRYETQCDRCGYPMDAGERAVVVDDGAAIYCGTDCRDRAAMEATR